MKFIQKDTHGHDIVWSDEEKRQYVNKPDGIRWTTECYPTDGLARNRDIIILRYGDIEVDYHDTFMGDGAGFKFNGIDPSFWMNPNTGETLEDALREHDLIKRWLCQYRLDIKNAVKGIPVK